MLCVTRYHTRFYFLCQLGKNSLLAGSTGRQCAPHRLTGPVMQLLQFMNPEGFKVIFCNGSRKQNKQWQNLLCRPRGNLRRIQLSVQLVLDPQLPVDAVPPVRGHLVFRRRRRLLRWPGLRIRQPRATEKLLGGVIVEPVLPRFKGPHDGVAEGARVRSGML